MKHDNENYIKRKVILKDIAIKTGYSINTVSHALKDKDDVVMETKSLIKKTASEMGYIPNEIASSLRSGKTNTIAVIVPDICDPIFGIWAKNIETELMKENYSSIIINTDENYKREEKAIKLALAKKVDGIIICPTQNDNKYIKYLLKIKIPFVLLGRYFSDLETDYVIVNDLKGGFLATQHLINKGRKDILFLNGFNYISSARERLEGYKKALVENNIEIRSELIKEINIVNNIDYYNIISDTLKRGIKFTGIFAFSDLIAWKTIYFLNKLNIRVPEDIAIVGYDNIQNILNYPYGVTTIAYPNKKLISETVKILYKSIKNTKSTEFIKRKVDVELVKGYST